MNLRDSFGNLSDTTVPFLCVTLRMLLMTCSPHSRPSFELEAAFLSRGIVN